jgi:hypothetical protein
MLQSSLVAPFELPPPLLPTLPTREAPLVVPCSTVAEFSPRVSAATYLPVTRDIGTPVSPLPTLNNSAGRLARELFVSTKLSARVQDMLNQKFLFSSCFVAVVEVGIPGR